MCSSDLLAADLHKSSEGLGGVGLTASLGEYTNLGGTLVVFALPEAGD